MTPFENLVAAITPDVRDLPDGELVRRFVAQNDAAAFGVIMFRHGPMVMGVAKRILGPAHEAVDDTFQATVMLFLERARSLKKPSLVGGWLYGVATRIAMKARAKRKNAPLAHDVAANGKSRLDAETTKILDEEMSKLPDKYRTPLVLHYFLDWTKSKIATTLDMPEGTVSAHLDRGRKRLHARLSKRGVTLTSGAMAGALGGLAETVLSSEFLNSAARLLQQVRSGDAAIAVSSTVRELVQTASTEWRYSTKFLCAGMICFLGVGGFLFMTKQQPHSPPHARRPSATQTLRLQPVAEKEAQKRHIHFDADFSKYAAGPLKGQNGWNILGAPFFVGNNYLDGGHRTKKKEHSYATRRIDLSNCNRFLTVSVSMLARSAKHGTNRSINTNVAIRNSADPIQCIFWAVAAARWDPIKCKYVDSAQWVFQISGKITHGDHVVFRLNDCGFDEEVETQIVIDRLKGIVRGRLICKGEVKETPHYRVRADEIAKLNAVAVLYDWRSHSFKCADIRRIVVSSSFTPPHSWSLDDNAVVETDVDRDLIRVGLPHIKGRAIAVRNIDAATGIWQGSIKLQKGTYIVVPRQNPQWVLDNRTSKSPICDCHGYGVFNGQALHFGKKNLRLGGLIGAMFVGDEAPQIFQFPPGKLWHALKVPEAGCELKFIIADYAHLYGDNAGVCALSVFRSKDSIARLH